jgi:hypothetical protein
VRPPELLRRLRVLPLALALLTVGATQPPSTTPIHVTHPLVGFTFVPGLAAGQGFEPAVALSQLLRKLHPDLVRIPIYWDQVEPSNDKLDFSAVDGLLQTVASANARRRARQVQVILVVGVRNLAWPEVHLPAWVGAGATLDLAQITASSDYVNYLEQSFSHFAKSRVLYAWQVENEPLDNTNRNLGQVALAGGVVADEVALLKSIDPVHRAIVTTYNSASVSLDMEATSAFPWLYNLLPGPKPAGHPGPALQLADILGLDVYVDTPSTPLGEASIPERIGWKAASLTYWASEAGNDGKEVWVTEMQGAPWDGEAGFNEEDLMESAQSYSGTGVAAVLLWGVESWLNSPAWMQAGQAAMAKLRA